MVDSGEVVLIAVVTHNSAQVLADLVASLDQGCGEVPWHLTIVDSGSSDDSSAVARRLAPAATVVELADNRGYAAGINAAVASAPPHTAVLAMNPDVRLDPGCVPELMRRLRSERAGIVVPRLRDARGELIFSMRRTPTVLRALGDALVGATRAGRIPLLGEVVTQTRLYERSQSTDWAEGSTQLISAECWAACGAWDESFFLYSEETEFHLRARDHGYPVWFVASAGAVHLEGGSSTSAHLWPLVVANRLLLYGRRHGRLRTAAFWMSLVGREASRALIGRATSRSALAVLMDRDRLRGSRESAWLGSP